MRLKSTIKNGRVVHSELRNNFGILSWSYKFYNDGFYANIIETIFDGECFKKSIYQIINGKKVLYLKEYKTKIGTVEESYYKNGNIATKVYRNYLGYIHNIGKSAYNEWYENGLRKLEIYYTMNKFNNPIGPAVSKWKETGYLLRHKYYSHGNKIHRDVLADRIEESFNNK